MKWEAFLSDLVVVFLEKSEDPGCGELHSWNPAQVAINALKFSTHN